MRLQKRVPLASYASIQVRLGLPPHPSQGKSRSGCVLTGIPHEVCEEHLACTMMHLAKIACRACPTARDHGVGMASPIEGQRRNIKPFWRYEGRQE